ncbi:uncharacterized protein Dvar_39400 [Desulfosarcina variabilis str. Montpellier]|uniref:hypothetical protein n=1 Tax=Desulfosarcina variabilis TaxID=2300 RepID=UPI003AFB09F1
MLLDASYAIWGGAFATISALLLGIFVIRSVNHIKQVFHIQSQHITDAPMPAATMQDNAHRALMFLMNQKTDSMLAALAKTIEQERQKLGVVVRKPSMPEEIDAHRETAPILSAPQHRAYDQVLCLAQEGTPIETIADQLNMSEAEVSLVVRLDAA